MSESKMYSPSQLRFSFEKLLSKGGHAAAVRFLSKVSIEDVTAFLNDGSPFDGVKWWITRQPGYKGLGHTAFMRRYKLNHVDSIAAFNGMKNMLDNPTYTCEQKLHYCEIYIKAAHESDRQQLQTYTTSKLGTATPVAPVASKAPPSIESPLTSLPAHYGLIDPNMRRLAQEIGMWAECQLWEVIEHVSDGSGKVDTNTVRNFLQAHGYTDAKFYRILNQGNGLWWTFKDGLIWYRGYHAIAAMLGARLPAERIAHYRGSNAIGGKTAKRVYAPLTGTKQVFMQNAFAAWIEQRRKSDSVTIANQTMATLWKVDIRTIQRWKKQCGQRHNFTEQAPHIDKHQITPDVPPHAVDTPNGGKLYQISSSYTPPDAIKKHNHIGRSQTARRAFYRALSIAHNTDRLSAKWAIEEQSEEKRYWTHDDIDTAFLQVDTTLRKPSSDTFLPRHVLLEGKRRVGVWETVTDTRQRVEKVYVS